MYGASTSWDHSLLPSAMPTSFWGWTTCPKWVEAVPCRAADHKAVLKFLKENILSRFGVPKAIISDEGSHFCNKPFENLLSKYGVKHKVATPYHPQTSGSSGARQLRNKDHPDESR